MRISLITRHQQSRDLTALHLAQLAERTGWTRDAAIRERSDLIDRLVRRADGYELDADHTDGRAPGETRKTTPLTAEDRRVIADELRTIARDVASAP